MQARSQNNTRKTTTIQTQHRSKQIKSNSQSMRLSEIIQLSRYLVWAAKYFTARYNEK